MSSNQRITRSEHVASIALPPGRIAQVLGNLHRRDVLIRIGLCLLAALCIWIFTAGWKPPFGYRSGYTPLRNIDARAHFAVADVDATQRLREEKRSAVKCIYANDPKPLQELQSALKGSVFEVLRASAFDELSEGVWEPFLPPEDQEPEQDERVFFARVRAALAEDTDLTRFGRAVQHAFERYESTGLLEVLEHAPESGSQMALEVYSSDKPAERLDVAVQDVRIAEVRGDIRARLAEGFREAGFADAHIAELTALAYHWCLNQSLPSTLRWDRAATEQLYRRIDSETVAVQEYAVGSTLVPAGTTIGPAQLDMLRAEHQVVVENMSLGDRIAYSLSSWGMYAALFLVCGVFIYYQRPTIIADLRKLGTMLAALVVTVALARLCTGELWQAQVVPIMLFGMTIAIAYSRDLALIFATAVSLLLSVALGMGLAEFVLMVATTATAVLLLNRIRSRTKLIYVGMGAAAAAIVTTMGIGTLTGETLGSWGGTQFPDLADWENPQSAFFIHLLAGAVWHGFCALLGGLIMTGLLPFIERLFDVQTDISLLELGDAAHPLLQELARRAPGTYNHSINVASLAESAAKSIGANGLLVRVGAYFHDIGKMFKPGYFVENQGREVNRHDSLLPAMSTLVIIAHVKDGADLARQHRLPPRIIDFIEQHHGTTLVEYFYREATRRSESNPEQESVDEAAYRYPGPRPQSREAGVLMLADAVESASRTLVDPTPARIENLVEDIVMKKLLDGQFDQCGITLLELNNIRHSLVKSLTAVYHARIKYPGQQTA